jgi:hypothetical protein
VKAEGALVRFADLPGSDCNSMSAVRAEMI